jgi:hypothetical protein
VQEEVCLLAATQTDAGSVHAGSSSAKASAAATALSEGSHSSAPEASLQVTAMACLQRAFLRLPAHPVHQRASLLRELATTHIRSTGGRRYRRVFGVPLSVPRPHLVLRGCAGDAASSSSSISAVAAAAGTAPEEGGRSIVHVTACTALLCLLLQVRFAKRGPALALFSGHSLLFRSPFCSNRVRLVCPLMKRSWLQMAFLL